MTFYIVVKINDNGQMITDDVKIENVANEGEALKQYDLSGDGGEVIEVYQAINELSILSI